MKRTVMGEPHHDVGNAAIFTVQDYGGTVEMNVYLRISNPKRVPQPVTYEHTLWGETFFNKSTTNFMSPIYPVGLIGQPFEDTRLIIAIDPRSKPSADDYNYIVFANGFINFNGGEAKPLVENTVIELVSPGNHSGILLFADGNIVGEINTWDAFAKDVQVSYEGY